MEGLIIIQGETGVRRNDHHRNLERVEEWSEKSWGDQRETGLKTKGGGNLRKRLVVSSVKYYSDI